MSRDQSWAFDWVLLIHTMQHGAVCYVLGLNKEKQSTLRAPMLGCILACQIQTGFFVVQRFVSDRFDLEKHILFHDGLVTARSLGHVMGVAIVFQKGEQSSKELESRCFLLHYYRRSKTRHWKGRRPTTTFKVQ
jgi:hypothetical protein